jgi:MFS family permease
MLPLTAGIVIFGPLSGILSDKYGPRWIATGGMIVTAFAFLFLAALPYNFTYLIFGLAMFIMGMGFGMFGAPNSASIMNSVPSEDRGIASGMMYTINNTAQTASMAIFFTVIIIGITQRFPEAMTASLSSIGAVYLAPALSNIPPTAALFSAFLGYNPVDAILSALPAPLVAHIPQTTLNTLTGTTWFPQTLQNAFVPSLRTSFYIGAILSVIAAILSVLRGEKYVHEHEIIKTKTNVELNPETELE